MATGASTADVAIILIDARHGVLHPDPPARVHRVAARHPARRRRHQQDGPRRLLARTSSSEIQRRLHRLRRQARPRDITFIPMSAPAGRQRASQARRDAVVLGPAVLDYLETVHIASDRNLTAFRFPVQYVIRPNLDFRGFAGTVASRHRRAGRRGDGAAVGQASRGEVDRHLRRRAASEPSPPQAVTLTLADEVDVSRGDMLVRRDEPPHVEQPDRGDGGVDGRAAARARPDVPQAAQARRRWRRRSRRCGTASTSTRWTASPPRLELNEVGHVQLSLSSRSRATRTAEPRPGVHPHRPADEQHGRRGHAPLRAAPLATPSRGRSSRSTVPPARRRRHRRRSCVWLTGLPGAGKSSIADVVERRLHALGRHTYLLDGANLRHGLSKDLGFAPSDRAENNRRAGEVAKILTDAGLIVIAAFVSPFRADRETVRSLFGAGEYLEVFVDLPSELAAERDTKGLYAKARDGALAEPHRRRLGVRAAREPRRPPRHDRARRRGRGRSRRRRARGAGFA